MIKLSYMFIAITFFLLVVTAISLIVLRLSKPDFSYAWPVAAIGSLLAWISTFLWQIQLPIRLVIINYSFKGVFNYSLSLIADGFNFPYAVGLTSLVLAVILTSAVQATTINPTGWARVLFLSILGLLVVLAENPLTLVIAWSLLDITGLISSLRAVEEPHLSERAVLSYSARVMGMGFVLWAGILSSSNGQTFNFSTVPPNIEFILLLGVILRTGSMLILLPYSKDPALRRGNDTTFYLVSTSANLILLTHLPVEIDNLLASTLLIIIIVFIGLLATFRWLRSPDELTGQPYWITGLASLAIVASMSGNPVGSAAWGSSILFIGGLIFLYSARKKWLMIILLVATFSLSALPYSLTATGWMSNSSFSWLPLILLLPLQGLLISSYVRSITRDGEANLDDYPNWVKVLYPMGFILLLLTSLLLGIFGWVGAGQIGAWIPGLIAGVISVTLSFIMVRIPLPDPLDSSFIHRPTALAESVSSVYGGLFRSIRSLLELLSKTFEGDGGFLWTILLLVVFISILRELIH
jgi:hypothetical protein